MPQLSTTVTNFQPNATFSRHSPVINKTKGHEPLFLECGTIHAVHGKPQSTLGWIKKCRLWDHSTFDALHPPETNFLRNMSPPSCLPSPQHSRCYKQNPLNPNTVPEEAGLKELQEKQPHSKMAVLVGSACDGVVCDRVVSPED